MPKVFIEYELRAKGGGKVFRKAVDLQFLPRIGEDIELIPRDRETDAYELRVEVITHPIDGRPACVFSFSDYECGGQDSLEWRAEVSLLESVGFEAIRDLDREFAEAGL